MPNQIQVQVIRQQTVHCQYEQEQDHHHHKHGPPADHVIVHGWGLEGEDEDPNGLDNEVEEVGSQDDQ